MAASPNAPLHPRRADARTASDEGPVKLTRAERNARTRAKLIEAAVKVVGLHGFSDASVAKITEEAAIAQGAFYNHFSSRVELLDLVLPSLTKIMMSSIAQEFRPGQSELDLEIARFVGYLRFVRSVPGFARALHEAEFYSPRVYDEHLQRILDQYSRILKPTLHAKGYDDNRAELLIAMLLGIRAKMTRHLTRNGIGDLTDLAIQEAADAYRQLISEPFCL